MTDHQLCGARTRQGGTCRKPPLNGATRCRLHGGASPNSLAKAKERITDAAASRELTRGLAAAYGDNVPAIDPAEAMLQAVSWKHAEVLALRFKVAGLEEGDMVWGVTREKTGGDDRGTTEEAKPNIWLALLHAAEEQLVKFSAAARAAKCDERRIQIAQQHGAQAAEMVKAILTAMLDVVVTTLRGAGRTDAQIEDAIRAAWADAVGVVVPREFRRLSAGEVA